MKALRRGCAVSRDAESVSGDARQSITHLHGVLTFIISERRATTLDGSVIFITAWTVSSQETLGSAEHFDKNERQHDRGSNRVIYISV